MTTTSDHETGPRGTARPRGGPRTVRAGVVLACALGAAGAGAAGALGAAGGPAGAAARHPDAPGCGGGAAKLTVDGTAAVTTTPNLLTLSFDVHTTGPTAGAALSSNDTSSTAVVHAVLQGGVAAKDVQTTDLTIQPNYTNTGTTVTGYGVDDTVVAKLRKLATAGTLIDAAVAAGGDATRIEGLSFSVTNPARAQARARTEAVRQAVGHARAMAAAAGEHLGGICSLRDETALTSTPVPLPGVFGSIAAAAPAVRGAHIQSGSQTVTAKVAVVYALTKPSRRTR